MTKTPLTIFASCCFAVIAGCVDNTDRLIQLEKQLDAECEKTRLLTRKVESLTTELSEKQQQIQSLQNLGPDRLKHLFKLKKIEISRYTGAINTDEKPGHDAIKVIFETVDKDGHVLKTAGDIKIRLFNLAAKTPDKTLLKEIFLPVEKASGKWSGWFSHYSITCPLPSDTSLFGNEVTVRVTFTEYLTGKVFTAQKLCSVNAVPN